MNYDVLRTHAPALKRFRWSGIIFDEAHYIKNRMSDRSRLSRGLVDATPGDPMFSLLGRALEDALQVLTAESAHAARLRIPRGDSNVPHRGVRTITGVGPARAPFYCRPGPCRIHPTTRRSA